MKTNTFDQYTVTIPNLAAFYGCSTQKASGFSTALHILVTLKFWRINTKFAAVNVVGVQGPDPLIRAKISRTIQKWVRGPVVRNS